MVIDGFTLLIESIVMVTALSAISWVFPFKTKRTDLGIRLLRGLSLGALGIFMLFLSDRMNPNTLFDIRSIFLPIISLVYGVIPTLIATLFMILYLILLGGSNLWIAILIITISTMIGLLWNRLNRLKSNRRNIQDYYLLGLIVHLVMFIAYLPATQDMVLVTGKAVGLPVLVIFPLVTMALGKIFDDHVSFFKVHESTVKAESKFRTIFDQAQIGIGLATLDGGFVDVNPQYATMLGYSKSDIMKLKHSDITHSDDWKSQYEEIERIKNKEISEFTLDNRFVTKNGNVFWAHLSVSRIELHDDQSDYLLFVIQDTTRKKESEIFMEYIAYHDQLTDCFNARYYEEFVEQQNEIKEFPLSIIRINVNGLKLINETVNHKAGDILLQTVARTIKSECRESSMIARIGSNEFVIIYKNRFEWDLKDLASVLYHAFEEESIEGMKVSVSIGYAIWEMPDDDYVEIYKLAESRMHSEEVVTKNSMYSKTIDIIINSLFEKNNREMLHSQRVSVICEKLARIMNFDPKNIEKIKIAGLMHDIGKIGISEEILNKNGRLDAAERNQIEKHSDAGYRILSSAREFSEIAECVLTHHERWDGNGYPKGLAGADIPLFSRIIAVADSFDAMTSKRSYREAMSLETVIKEIEINAGKQFDPNIVGLFLENIVEFKDII